MTKNQFVGVIAGLPAPFWIVIRNGDQLNCSKIVAITEDRISIVCDGVVRTVYLSDVQSVRLTLQIGNGVTPPAVFTPALAAEI
jgi:hypothetical protein